MGARGDIGIKVLEGYCSSGFSRRSERNRRRSFSGRRTEHDQWHPDGRTIEVYEFTGADDLLEAFFAAMERALRGRGVA